MVGQDGCVSGGARDAQLGIAVAIVIIELSFDQRHPSMADHFITACVRAISGWRPLLGGVQTLHS